MVIRIFPVVGAALNFGARRMETIMRVAWLPVVLLLICNMVTLFAYVSVAAGRLVTFEQAVPTLQALQYYAGQAAAVGWERAPQTMAIITVASLATQLILIASFVAPLIRYAGLGERPADGLLRVPFGPDQLRFIGAVLVGFLVLGVLVLGPMYFATSYTASYIADALSKTFASFPDEQSLHSIELVTRETIEKSNGTLWIYQLGWPLIATAPIFFIFWALMMNHFSPRNRSQDTQRSPNFLLRALASLFGSVLVLGLLIGYLILPSQQSLSLGLVAGFAMPAAFLAIFYYLQLRAAPYPGVSVCRSSMGLTSTLAVTRGWNLVRVFFILLLLSIFLLLIQFFINQYILGQWIGYTVNILFQSVQSYANLTTSGEGGGWVQPLFIWIWNFTKILVNIFWMFFSYGVIAGLFGRFYLESTRANS